MFIFFEANKQKFFKEGKNKKILFKYDKEFKKSLLNIDYDNKNSIILNLFDFITIKIEYKFIESLQEYIFNLKEKNRSIRIFFDGGCSPPNNTVNFYFQIREFVE